MILLILFVLFLCILTYVYYRFYRKNNIEVIETDIPLWEKIKDLSDEEKYTQCRTIGARVNAKYSDFPIITKKNTNITLDDKPQRMSEGEYICLQFMNSLFDKEFVRDHPEWCLNDSTGKCLELDVYNKELGIAVEYNGMQHYFRNKHFHKTKKDYKDQLERDKIKIQKCKDNGLFLIIVPFFIENEDIPYFIYVSMLEVLYK